MSPTRGPLALLLVLAVPGVARAQSFNIDTANGAGTPDPRYGGAANQPGVWNAHPGNDPAPFPLVDLLGNPTSVTLNMPLPFGPAAFDHPGTSGDEAALLDDYFDLHSTPAAFELIGLRPGRYGVYTYAWGPDDAAFRTTVEVNGQGAVSIGGGWPGQLQEGLVYAHHLVTITGTQSISIYTFGRPRGTLNGFQIVEGEERPTPDAGLDDQGGSDATSPDATVDPDSGAPTDAGGDRDLGAADLGPADTGGRADLGTVDGGTADAGLSPNSDGGAGADEGDGCNCRGVNAPSPGLLPALIVGLYWRRRRRPLARDPGERPS